MTTSADTPAPPAEIRAILRDVARIVRRHLPDPRYRVFLYGSWATGRAQRGSDVDIGIEGPGPVPAPVLAEIREGCEALVTLYTVEVVDFSRMAESIRRHARGRILEAEAA